jgi:hypothetical protein
MPKRWRKALAIRPQLAPQAASFPDKAAEIVTVAIVVPPLPRVKDEDRWETRMNSYSVKISQFRLLLAWVVVER